MSGGAGSAALGTLLAGAVDTCLGFVRGLDPDAAAEIDAQRRREVTRPSVVVVGETKRGKSSLVNALIGVTGLSPVDAAVATSAYLEFDHGPVTAARAFVPGEAEAVDVPVDRLRDWATVSGVLPQGARAPRRIEVTCPAPLLRYVSLVDTPGAGGLDPAHTEIALDAVSRAAALLFVVDASTPFTRPELDFLIEASKRVNVVVFALTKTDAYPGWRTILADNRAQLQAHAPRFAAAAWFPVSARLAELALTLPAADAGELVDASQVAPLQHALIELAGNGHLLAQANVLRTIRSELVRLDLTVGQQVAACDPDPGEVQRAKQERAGLAARKRTESRQWSLALNTETQRARVEATGRLRTAVGGLQEQFLARIDAARGEALKQLPAELDRELHAVSLRFSHELQARFRAVAERTLAQVFPPAELQFVVGRINATLRHALASRPRRDGGGADNVMVALSAGGMAFMAGRGVAAGASALGAGAVVGGGLLVPVAGLGLGLAAGAFILYRRRVATDRQQARMWLREVLGEARAALTDELAQRFTDLQYALTVALDDAIERRLAELDAHIAEIDAAAARDKAQRTRRRSALQARRDTIRARVKQVDEVLARARVLAPTAPAAEAVAR